MVNIVGEVLQIFRDITVLLRSKLDLFKEMDDDELLDLLERYYITGGLDWLYRKDKLIAVGLYYISEDGTIATIFNMVIEDDIKDSIKIMHYFIARGWMRFPSLRWIRFERALKDKEGFRMIRISRFFKGGK